MSNSAKPITLPLEKVNLDNFVFGPHRAVTTSTGNAMNVMDVFYFHNGEKRRPQIIFPSRKMFGVTYSSDGTSFSKYETMDDERVPPKTKAPPAINRKGFQLTYQIDAYNENDKNSEEEDKIYELFNGLQQKLLVKLIEIAKDENITKDDYSKYGIKSVAPLFKKMNSDELTDDDFEYVKPIFSERTIVDKSTNQERTMGVCYFKIPSKGIDGVPGEFTTDIPIFGEVPSEWVNAGNSFASIPRLDVMEIFGRLGVISPTISFSEIYFGTHGSKSSAVASYQPKVRAIIYKPVENIARFDEDEFLEASSTVSMKATNDVMEENRETSDFSEMLDSLEVNDTLTEIKPPTKPTVKKGNARRTRVA
jgi:hypothetical protein